MMRHYVALSIVAALLAPGPLAAQVPTPLADSIGRLRLQLVELSRAADSAHRTRLERPRVPLMQAPLRIEAESLAAVVLAAPLAETLEQFERMYGHVSLAPEPALVLRVPDSARLVQTGIRLGREQFFAAGDSINVGRLVTARQLMEGLATRLEGRALAGAPNLARWVGGPWAMAPQAQVMAAGYEALIVSRSHSARACGADDDAACERVLGLLPLMWPGWKAEYSVTVRRQMALELMAGHGTRTATEVQCEHDDDQAACDTLLRQDRERVEEFALAQPAVRASLLRFAAARAGASLWSRLAADSGPLTLAKMADAARMPPEQLLSAWRTELRTSRRPSIALGATTVAALVVWLVLLLAAAGGLSRWR